MILYLTTAQGLKLAILTFDKRIKTFMLRWIMERCLWEENRTKEGLAEMNRYGATYLLVCRGDIAVGVIGSSDIIHAYEKVE